MPKIRVTVLVSEPTHGLFYQRLGIPFKRLDPDLFHVTWRSFSDPWYKLDAQSDVFVMAHASEPVHMTVMDALKAEGKKVILDHDDLLDNTTTDHPEHEFLQHCKETVPRMLQAADHVVVTTEALRRQAQSYNKNVSLVPNCFDTEIIRPGYMPQPKAYKKGFIVGWCGGKTHIADQWEFMEALETFMDEREDVRAHFKIMCPQRLLDRFGARVWFDPATLHHYDYHPWLSSLPWDLCLVGLYPHAFNDAKSDLRLVDMSPHGIPVLASAAADFLKHEKDRRLFIASSPEEWYAGLCFIYENRKELRERAEIARQWVWNERTDFHGAALWQKVILQTLGRDGPGTHSIRLLPPAA